MRTVKEKKRIPSRQKSYRGDRQAHELEQFQSLSEDRGRGAAGRSVAVGDPVVGKPGAGAAAADREQVSPVLSRRREVAEAGAVPAQGARFERGGNRGVAEARRARAACWGWEC